MQHATISDSLRIKADNERLESAMMRSFEKVANGEVGLNSIYSEFKLLRRYIWSADMSRRGKESHLSVSYAGRRVSFEFSTENFKYSHDKLPSFGMYETQDKHSNETYSKATIEDISSLHGIDSVLAVSGGLTQQLLKIGVLQEGNDIRNITMVDISERQLLFNMVQLMAYDSMPGKFRAFWHMPDAGHRCIRVAEGTKIHLAESTIGNAVESAGTGRYFIDSSNIYGMVLHGSDRLHTQDTGMHMYGNDGYWESWQPEGRRFLSAIADNPKILAGSVYMAASSGSKRAVLQEKSGKDMVGYSYCDGTPAHGTCAYPGVALRK